MIIKTEKEYKKVNAKIKRLAKKRDKLNFKELEDAMVLIEAAQTYEKDHPKPEFKG